MNCPFENAACSDLGELWLSLGKGWQICLLSQEVEEVKGNLDDFSLRQKEFCSEHLSVPCSEYLLRRNII